MYEFDFRKPDYTAVFSERAARLTQLRQDPALMQLVRAHYKQNPADFINDWGITADPRNLDIGLPVIVPFILFPKQREWVEWIMQNWKDRERGITEKSRDMGISWLAMALSVTLCIFNDDMVIGVGSAKEEHVDKLGLPKCLFWKARMFAQYLPLEFRGVWDSIKNAPHMRIMFPKTNSIIAGEAGDNIGRGDRTSIYFVDEAMHIERPEQNEASLSNTTFCRQDLSSVKGMGNPIAIKRHSGDVRVFTFHWRDDPRKDDAWYEKMKRTTDPVTLAQEVDINYLASVENVVIPSAWVQAAVDAHIKLGITNITGTREGGLDVADRGKDKNAFAVRHGILLEDIEKWPAGENTDIFATTERAAGMVDARKLVRFRYDADGVGGGVRGDVRKLNEERKQKGRKPVEALMHIGSGKVLDPERCMVEGRKNKDYFGNYKAQSWWHVRLKFERTYNWVKNGIPCDPDEIISISSKIKILGQLQVELSQATYDQNGAGKLIIDKQPDETLSPNLADAVVIAFAPRRPPMKISSGVINRMQQRVTR